jgi:hypothetical protein
MVITEIDCERVKWVEPTQEIGRMTLDWHAFLAIWMNFQAPLQHKILQTDDQLLAC